MLHRTDRVGEMPQRAELFFDVGSPYRCGAARSAREFFRDLRVTGAATALLRDCLCRRGVDAADNAGLLRRPRCKTASWLALEVLTRYKDVWKLDLVLRPTLLGGVFKVRELGEFGVRGRHTCSCETTVQSCVAVILGSF